MAGVGAGTHLIGMVVSITILIMVIIGTMVAITAEED
jgi:hypothetical protein